MYTPIVTENVAKLEPITRDDFIDSLAREIVPPQDRPPHRLVDAASGKR
jgi:hypothetical protein